MSLKKVLIIEDNPKHLQDVKLFIDERKKAGADLKVDFVSTLEEAQKALDTEKYDGIISDVFFPEREGASPEPATPAPNTTNEDVRLAWAENVSGVKLIRAALAHQTPFILCTSTYHHGRKTQPVTDWIRKNRVDYIVDAPSVGQGEAEHKNWQSAYIRMAYLSSLIEHKLFRVTEKGVERSNELEAFIKNNQDKYNEFSRSLEFIFEKKAERSIAGAAWEVSYGLKEGKLHTIDPILTEVLDGPCKGLVPYSTEAPTVEETVERAKKDWSFKSYNLPLEANQTEEDLPRAAEKFIEKWKEDKKQVESAWKEWLKNNKESSEREKSEVMKIK